MGENGFYVNCTLKPIFFGDLEVAHLGLLETWGYSACGFYGLRGAKMRVFLELGGAPPGVFGAWWCPAGFFWDLGLPLLVFFGGLGDSQSGVFEA